MIMWKNIRKSYMNITLRHVEAFFYTAKLGNLSLAAEKLGITQAAASMALREFENQMGEQLFERIGKKLVINESGKAVMSNASEIIGRAEELAGYFSDRSVGLTGSLTVGASSTIGNYVLPEYIANFIDANSACDIQLKVGNTDEIIEKVLKYDVDLGIIEGLCFDPIINVLPWMDDELAVFCAADNPLSEKKNISQEDLERCGWILREPGSGTRVIFENQVNALSMSLNIKLVLGHTEAIKNAVAKSGNVSCLSRCVLEDMEKLGKIKLLDTPFLNLKRKFFVLIHKDKFHTRIMGEFLGRIGVVGENV